MKRHHHTFGFQFALRNLLPVLGILFAALGLTQSGPCPGGGQDDCLVNADCDDDNGCTTDTCNQTTYECSNAAACDEDHCIDDACVECIENADCELDEVCNDSNECEGVLDLCAGDDDCEDADICVDGLCVAANGDVCAEDEHCGDGDDCTIDTCTDGVCSNEVDPTCIEETDLAVFNDPDSEFGTTDVRDVDDTIIYFDTSNDSIVLPDTQEEFNVGQWMVNGNFLEATQTFEVRFGTVGGEPRAYFVEAGNGFICRYNFTETDFFPSGTTTPVPQN